MRHHASLRHCAHPQHPYTPQKVGRFSILWTGPPSFLRAVRSTNFFQEPRDAAPA